MQFDVEYDFVSIGSGLAGCSAALAAHAEGYRSIVLEKSEKVGGGTSYSYGGLWVGNNHLARAAGIEDDRDDTAAYLRHIGGGYQIAANREAFIDTAPVALEYFCRLGIPFQLVDGLVDHYHGHAPGSRAEGRVVETALIGRDALPDWWDRLECSPELPMGATFAEAIAWGGIGNARNWDAATMAERRERDLRGFGAGLAANFVKALVDRRIPLRPATRVEQLIIDRGRVVGVLADTASGPCRIGARLGVFVSTGGYEANPELVDRFEDIKDWVSMFPDTLTGDGLVMGSEIGAAVHVIRRHMVLFLGFRVPAVPGGRGEFLRLAGIQELARPHTLVVNAGGRRFADESYFQLMVDALRDFDVWEHRYPNLPCYLVFDDQYRQKYSFAGLPVGEVPSWVERAATPERLARKLGVDPAGLLESIKRMNKFSDSGIDEDFQRGEASWARYYAGDLTSPNPNLGPLWQAPYFGVPLVASGMSAAGLLTDVSGRVQHVRGHAIPGLYATGNASAFVDYGAGYQAGLSLARGLAFSYAGVMQAIAEHRAETAAGDVPIADR